MRNSLFNVEAGVLVRDPVPRHKNTFTLRRRWIFLGVYGAPNGPQACSWARRTSKLIPEGSDRLRASAVSRVGRMDERHE